MNSVSRGVVTTPGAARDFVLCRIVAAPEGGIATSGLASVLGRGFCFGALGPSRGFGDFDSRSRDLGGFGGSFRDHDFGSRVFVKCLLYTIIEHCPQSLCSFPVPFPDHVPGPFLPFINPSFHPLISSDWTVRRVFGGNYRESDRQVFVKVCRPSSD